MWLRSRFSRVLALASAAFAFGLAGTVAAAPVVVTFAGVIDFVDDPNLPLGSELMPKIALGTPFQGAYTIDPDLLSSSSAVAPDFYRHSGIGLGSLDLEVAVHDFSRAIDMVFIGEAFIDTFIGPHDFWSLPGPFTGLHAAAILFRDTTLQRISDSSSFFVNRSLIGWDSADVIIFAITPAGPITLAEGAITDVVVIPESSSAILVALGLATLAGRRRLPQ